jgi:hypothetical protein
VYTVAVSLVSACAVEAANAARARVEAMTTLFFMPPP